MTKGFLGMSYGSFCISDHHFSSREVVSHSDAADAAIHLSAAFSAMYYSALGVKVI